MKLGRFVIDGTREWGIIEGTTVRIAPASVTLDQALADRRTLDEVVDARLTSVSLDEVSLKAPVPDPPQFIGVGMNYSDHVSEVGAATPERPITFGFHKNAIIGPGDAIELPPMSTEIDWEVELAVVIGTGGRDIPLDAALDAVAGYTIVNDVSARDIQFDDGQWGRAKSLDTFKPMGPWIVTADELGAASDLAISLDVNGVTKQRSNTAQLIFDVPSLVSYLSRSFTLLPGAVIATGTPGGVGFSRTPPEFLRDGDIVELEVEGIGRLVNPVAGNR